MKKYLGLGVLILTMFVFSGCGHSLVENKLENDLEKQLGGNAEVNVDENGYSIETEGGSMQAGENVSLPEDFPADVYVIEGKILSSFSESTMGSQVVQIATNKSLDEVKELYMEKLVEKGWTSVSNFSQPDAVSLSFQKDGVNLTISASEEDGQMVVTIMLANPMF